MPFWKNPSAAGVSFAGPWLVGFACFFLWPLAASAYWSFCEFDLVNAPRWIGGANYAELGGDLLAGRAFGAAVLNTAYYVFWAVPGSIVLGIALAAALSRDGQGARWFRTLVYLPSVLPVVTICILWMWLLDAQQGWVNGGLVSLGLPPQNWLNQARSAISIESWELLFKQPLAEWRLAGSKDALILMAWWGVGTYMVIYLAALRDIPRSLYEAAQLDGANGWHQFRFVTLPLLSPVIFFHCVIGVIRGLQSFTNVYLLSEGTGEPGGSLQFVSLQLFLTAFQDLRVGYASAVSLLLLLALSLATWWLFHVSRDWVFYRNVQ